MPVEALQIFFFLRLPELFCGFQPQLTVFLGHEDSLNFHGNYQGVAQLYQDPFRQDHNADRTVTFTDIFLPNQQDNR
jgi:hypothetical protein